MAKRLGKHTRMAGPVMPTFANRAYINANKGRGRRGRKR